jgi:hypothetical protein
MGISKSKLMPRAPSFTSCTTCLDTCRHAQNNQHVAVLCVCALLCFMNTVRLLVKHHVRSACVITSMHSCR